LSYPYGSNDKNDRPGGEGLARSVSAVEEVSRKRPFKSLVQDVSSSNTYSRGNNNNIGRSGSFDGEQVNESIPEGLESMVRRMISTATQEMQNRMDTIQNENIELKDKCNELEIKVKDLTLKNEYNEWSYKAEDIPASYWLSRGFSEEYAQQMGSFLSEMKYYIHKLRRGEPPKEINLLLEDDILHDDILLPHWREFSNALKQYQKFNHRENYGIECFRIDDVQLQQEVLDMISPALQTLHMKNLRLSGNTGRGVVSFAADIIQHNSYIHGMSWSNQIESVDDMQRLCNSICDSAGSSFSILGFHNCFDGNSREMMQKVLHASHYLDLLGLPNNGIGSVGAHLIANFFTSNPRLKLLNLMGNNLNDADAALLANALQRNTNLERIYLANNNIPIVETFTSKGK